ncbi:hypothetical protein LTR36_000834 [Oleoguttula mirabilis]|uniref:Uncharacterized protein n=1 Tax=Oleoguttula mirabilis TaxID=1507867 RepID=A0AAV9J3Z4_9PEZI|nr:hypothetical protein LTR36_000834 [Oleoguttula mirabilis]
MTSLLLLPNPAISLPLSLAATRLLLPAAATLSTSSAPVWRTRSPPINPFPQRPRPSPYRGHVHPQLPRLFHTAPRPTKTLAREDDEHTHCLAELVRNSRAALHKLEQAVQASNPTKQDNTSHSPPAWQAPSSNIQRLVCEACRGRMAAQQKNPAPAPQDQSKAAAAAKSKTTDEILSEMGPLGVLGCIVAVWFTLLFAFAFVSSLTIAFEILGDLVEGRHDSVRMKRVKRLFGWRLGWRQEAIGGEECDQEEDDDWEEDD